MKDREFSVGAKSRIAEYDIIKGICIFLVAVMHTGHPVYFMEYGFLFAFFFVSGATFRRKPFGQFLKSKLSRIYIPFVLANFAGYFIGKYYYGLSGYGGYGYSFSEAARRIFTFQIAENIMSPSWFLLPMFLVVFVFWFLHASLDKLKYKDELLLGGSFLIFLVGLYVRQTLATVIWNKCSVLFALTYALFFCVLGYYYQNHPKVRSKVMGGRYAPVFFLTGVIMLNEIWSHYEYTLNVRYGETSSGLMTVFVSVMCVFIIVYLAKWMTGIPVLEKMFCLLGRHSLAIMLFHIISYGVVTILVHHLTGWEYPATWAFGYYSEQISYVNALAGVVLPTAAAEAWRRLMHKVKRK